jgi:hypothetical protein
MTVFCGCLSSHVCKRLIKGQNSQILRRPQDDSPCEGPVTLKPTPIFVILRPPRDLVFFSFFFTLSLYTYWLHIN